jgi:hypothetical protein
MANDFFTYVDNVWTKGANAEECWQSTRFAASKYNFLGLQDAARKRRGPSCDAGPWAGSTVLTSSGTMAVTVTPGHSQKAKGIIQWISDGIQSGAPMCHKTLESYQGFLIYISRAYPYLALTRNCLAGQRGERTVKFAKGCCQLGRGYFVQTFPPSEDFGLCVSKRGMGNVIGQLTMGNSPLLVLKMRQESSWCRTMMKKDVSCQLGMGTIWSHPSSVTIAIL